MHIDELSWIQLLWLPFALAVLLTVVPYSISGIKKGTVRSVISLIATLAAGVCSVFASYWLSGLLKPTVQEALHGYIPEEVPAFLLDGILRAAVALLLYPIFLIILTSVLKWIGRLLTAGWHKARNPLSKAAGLAIRLIDCGVFALLLTLPLYGTLAMYGPVVQDMMALGGEQAQWDDTLEQVQSHPLVSIAGTDAPQVLYQVLAQGEVNTQITGPGLGEALTDVMAFTQTAAENPEGLTREDLQSLITSLVENPAALAWLETEGAELIKSPEISQWLEQAGDSVLTDVEDLLGQLELTAEQKQQLEKLLNSFKNAQAENG